MVIYGKKYNLAMVIVNTRYFEQWLEPLFKVE